MITTRDRAKTASQRHAQLQLELDALYDFVFSQPTPESPEREEARAAMQHANERYEVAKQSVSSEERAIYFPDAANKNFDQGASSTTHTMGIEPSSAFGVNGTASNIAQGDMLGAQNVLGRGEKLVQRASQYSLEVDQVVLCLNNNKALWMSALSLNLNSG